MKFYDKKLAEKITKDSKELLEELTDELKDKDNGKRKTEIRKQK